MLRSVWQSSKLTFGRSRLANVILYIFASFTICAFVITSSARRFIQIYPRFIQDLSYQRNRNRNRNRNLTTRIVYKKGFFRLDKRMNKFGLENHARFKKAIQSANAYSKLTNVNLCSFIKSLIIYNPCSYYCFSKISHIKETETETETK